MQLFEIRTATLDDLSVVADLFRRSSLSNDGDREVLLANPAALVFDDLSIREQRTRVAVIDRRIVGFATTRPTDDVDELDDLFVDPDWKRRGIATLLVGDAVAIASARRSRRIEVTANPEASAFYASAGFVLDGIVDTAFAPGHRMHLDVARDET